MFEKIDKAAEAVAAFIERAEGTRIQANVTLLAIEAAAKNANEAISELRALLKKAESTGIVLKLPESS